MKKYFFILIFFIVYTFQSNSQDSLTKTKSSIDTFAFSEAKAYKMLYENQVEANDGILKTIFYALGGLGTAVLLVFASNWWFNEKKVKDVIKDIDSRILEIKKDITSELTEKIRLETKEDNKELIKNSQKQLELFNETYNQQIKSINETINLQNSNLREIFDGKDMLLREMITAEQKNRTSDVAKIFRALHRVEYYMWDARGIHRNAFKALVEELGYKLKTETDIRDVRLNLQNMSANLDVVKKLFLSDKKEALELFEKLPEDKETMELKNELVIKLEKIELMK